MKNGLQSHSLKGFIYKSLLLFLPFLGISVYYFYSDPFKILYDYGNYSYANYYDQQPYELNREIISTKMLLKNKNKYHYNSFILGSCESYVFHAVTWNKYLDTNDAIFHYPAASENILGIANKLKYLDKMQLPIKNCLIVMDNSTFKQTTPRTSTIHVSDPSVSGEGKLKFQIRMFKSFFSNMFCIQYIDYTLTGSIKAYMKNNLAIVPGDIEIVENTNEYYYTRYEKAIKQDSVKFYRDSKRKFYLRDTLNPVVIQYPLLHEKELFNLKEIKSIFDKQQTDYYIILSPMYDQVALNESDLKKLIFIFGEKRIFNYSGISKYSKNTTNYYDNFHYKPQVANEIMREIYYPKN
jgi:hypothetical protein